MSQLTVCKGKHCQLGDIHSAVYCKPFNIGVAVCKKKLKCTLSEINVDPLSEAISINTLT